LTDSPCREILLTSFEQKLLSFVGYLDAHDLDVITVDAALAGAMATPRSTDEVHWSRRLMVVRVFARHLAALDPRTQIPPSDLLPHHYGRVTLCLFGDDEIARLMEAAGALRPTPRGLTWQTLLGLLTVTGMFSRGQPSVWGSNWRVSLARKLIVED
jgi:integrase/recombinase XerD